MEKKFGKAEWAVTVFMIIGVIQSIIWAIKGVSMIVGWIA